MEKGSFDTSGIPGGDEQPLAGIPGAEAYTSGPAHAQAATSAQPSRQPPSGIRTIVSLVFAIVLGLFFAFLLLGCLIEITSSHSAPRSGSLAAEIVVAVVSAVVVLLCVEWAVHAEHRLRHPQAQPVRGARSASRAPRAHARGNRRYGPRTLAISGAVFGVLALVFVGVGIGKIVDAQHSSYVQDHGIRATAQVIDVNNIELCTNRGGCTDTAEIAVRLSPPVNGASTSTVHYPSHSNLFDGQQIQVLVDPRNPAYAELPGKPAVTSTEWLLSFGFALFLGGLSVQWGRRLWVLRRSAA